MIRAIVAHSTTQPEYGSQSMYTEHESNGRRFGIYTGATREWTVIRLREQPI